MPTAKLSLQTPECLLSDIQIWSNAELSHPGSEDRLNLISVVNHSKIPLFLVSCGPFDVYSEHHDTEGYFFDTLVCSEENMGLLAKTSAENSECYVVFYVDRASAPRVRCYYIDFSVLQQVDEMRSFGVENREEDVFFTAKPRANTVKSDTSVFDRVLEHKTSKRMPSIAAPQPPVAMSSGLITSHQISQAVNRVVLSGLRLRGLSTNASSSANDKIAIREIYQMTKKAALFALRKYGYDFNRGISNGDKEASQGVSLDDIQSIVESLLSTFVDVESSSFTKTDTQKHGLL